MPEIQNSLNFGSRKVRADIGNLLETLPSLLRVAIDHTLSPATRAKTRRIASIAGLDETCNLSLTAIQNYETARDHNGATRPSPTISVTLDLESSLAISLALPSV